MKKAWAYYNENDLFAAAWLRELIKAGHIAPGEVDTRSIEDVVPNDLAGFTQHHFFAGVGVWSYALRCAGWPDDKPIWTGSCPCQPFSSAGKGEGFTDERHLWPAFFHLIGQCLPVTIFGEQVASKDGLAWFDLVASDLEGAGYTCGAVDTCSAGVGAPHIRQRLYWVADSVPAGRPQGRARTGDGSPAGSGSVIGVGNTHNARLADVTSQGQVEGAAVGRSGASRRMDDTLCNRCGARRNHNGEHDRQQPCADGNSGGCAISEAQECGSCLQNITGGLEHPSGIGRERREASAPGYNDVEPTPQRQEGQYGAGLSSAHRLPEDIPGPVNGFWRNSDWLLCRDGRFRPVRPGTFPLVNGAAARVGRLRGYGNGLNKEQAQAFIEAFMAHQVGRGM